jgi:glutamine synthetase
MAPRYEETDIAVDHNQLVMAMLRKVAMRHGLAAIVHEKPFAGVNGSGKHCNWSMSIVATNDLDGVNLLKPGKTPHQNIRFLLFLAAVLKGVQKHQGLLRAGIATSGNEHRLGANEAPPAIISVFLGDMLTRVIEDIAAGKTSPTNAEQAMLKLGVAKLPEIQQDNTDRNRTSPFAFTGMKFEFRAVGGSQSIAFPVMILNAAVAEAIGELTDELRKALKGAKTVDDAALKVVREAFKATAAIRFEGNNYSDEWVKEAKKRGLLNLRTTPEALATLATAQAETLFTSLGILSKEELHSRYHVRLERYTKDLLIELHTLQQMIDTQVLPAGYAYLGSLQTAAAAAKAAGIKVVPQVKAAEKVGALVATLQTASDALETATAKAEGMHDRPEAQAKFITTTCRDAMAAVREASDALELAIGDDYWPLPRYREMLFPV